MYICKDHYNFSVACSPPSWFLVQYAYEVTNGVKINFYSASYIPISARNLIFKALINMIHLSNH
jgi:hypothetical protein